MAPGGANCRGPDRAVGGKRRCRCRKPGEPRWICTSNTQIECLYSWISLALGNRTAASAQEIQDPTDLKKLSKCTASRSPSFEDWDRTTAHAMDILTSNTAITSSPPVGDWSDLKCHHRPTQNNHQDESTSSCLVDRCRCCRWNLYGEEPEFMR